ncbi:MAG: hypothetical protein JSW68_14565 [Burkholderiales bacterium]|nr:MAG: hypothetical protein JSW68_14565 [Burkholderiales bacterium]
MSLEDLCREYLQMEQAFRQEAQDRMPSVGELDERARLLAGLHRDIRERVAAGEALPDWFSPHPPPGD